LESTLKYHNLFQERFRRH